MYLVRRSEKILPQKLEYCNESFWSAAAVDPVLSHPPSHLDTKPTANGRVRLRPLLLELPKYRNDQESATAIPRSLGKKKRAQGLRIMESSLLASRLYFSGRSFDPTALSSSKYNESNLQAQAQGSTCRSFNLNALFSKPYESKLHAQNSTNYRNTPSLPACQTS
jgi:hypothetical protein